MIKYGKFASLWAGFFLVCFTSWSQQKLKLESLIPPAPNAAELGKYGSIPVGTLTGVPEIGFPLYTVSSGSLSLPISLSYHASGYQANQRSTDVGLGWTVMAGGTISRTVYGSPDDGTYGYFNFTPPSYSTLLGTNNYFTMQNYTSNPGYDLEPDLFSYNIGGQSGKFYMNAAHNFVTIPFAPIKIQKSLNGAGKVQFQLTDDGGNNYYFTQYSTSASTLRPVMNTISSWYMTSMVSADFTDTISFVYESHYIEDPMEQDIFSIGKNMTYANSSVSTNFVLGSELNGGTMERNNSTSSYNELLLKQINFKNGFVRFNRNTTRKDVLQLDKSLDEIQVYNSSNVCIKKFVFNHSYFTSTPFVDDWIHNRLKLTGFTEGDSTLSVRKDYSFNYEATPIPTLGTYAIDYWGFYNGANNTSLIPVTTVYAKDINSVSFVNGESYSNGFVDPTENWTIGDANREPSAAYMQAGILNKITYPTGGYSLMEYEPHQYLSDEYVKQTINNSLTTIGINSSTKSEGIKSFSYASAPEFTAVNNMDVVANLTINFTASNMQNNQFGPTQLVTFRNSAGTILQSWLHTGDITQPLTVNARLLLNPNSSYSIKQEVYGGSTVAVTSNVSWAENSNTHPVKIGGGLRIKSIKHFSSDNLQASEENYSYGINENGLGVKLFDERLFYRNYENVVSKYLVPIAGGSGSCTPVIGGSNPLFIRKYLGISKYNSLNYSGSPVLYSQVTKYQGAVSNNIGKTVQNYNVVLEPYSMPDEFINSGSYGAITTSWTQGDLLDETHYKKDGSQYIPVTKVVNEYTQFNQNQDIAVQIRQHKQYVNFGECNISLTGPEPTVGTYGQGYFAMFTYPIKTGINKKTKETRYQYDPTNASAPVITTITNFQYQNAANRYLSETSTISSDGSLSINRTKYPQDFADAVSTAMVAKNMLVPVLEAKSFKSVSGTETLLSTLQTNYRQAGNLFLKDNVKASTGSLTPETRILYTQYDFQGNLVEQQKVNDVPNSYVWDYLLSYPIAECTNASVSNIAATSFEADGKGNWSFSGAIQNDIAALTGKRDYPLSNGNITKTGLDVSKTFVVSYWSKSGSALVNGLSGVAGLTRNGWTYYEHNLSAGISSITISGSVIIDELRLFPKGAVMTTYTYEPLIGMTSQCDARNLISYYEYDGLGRLILVRDQDKNIVKKICYNLSGQAENCTAVTYYNVAASQTFTRNNCGAGYTGGTVTYSVAAGTYSSTVSQAAADQLAQNDIAANGQNYANANGTCTGTCTFSAASGFTSVSNGFTPSGSTVSFYVVFYANNAGSVSWGAYNVIGTITGVCKPSTTQTLTMSSSGRTWSVQISPTGQLSVKLLTGTNPTGTTPIGLSGGVYNL